MNGKYINEIALDVIVELSKKYNQYEFFFTCVNELAENLPEVGTILNKGLSDEEVNNIDIEYGDILWPRVKNLDTRLYDGMTIVKLENFDRKWFSGDCYYIRVKNGIVTPKR